MATVRHQEEQISENLGALARCVGDVALFATDHWGQRPFVHRSGGSFDDLLSTGAICDLLELTARRPTFRMVRDGSTIAPSEYTRTIRMGGASVSEIADVDRIARLLAAGATLVLQGMERVHAPVRAFALALHAEISHPVQANAYLSPPGSAGLARHADDHDVLILQVAGAKSWDVEGLGSIDVEAGDVIYIPRGCSHEATTNARHSLHITVGIPPVTLGNVLQRLLEAADVGLDRRLPLGYGLPKARDVVTDIVAGSLVEVARHLMIQDPADVVDSERARVEHRLGIPNRLRVELDIMAITDATRIRRAGTDNCARFSTIGDRVVLNFADREMRMPTTASGALDAILTIPELTVGQLVGLNPQSRLVLARRLLRERWIEIVPSEG